MHEQSNTMGHSQPAGAGRLLQRLHPADSDGEAIFQAACVECHSPGDDMPANMYFSLKQENTNPTYIAYKSHGGGITMPKFPNIRGRKLDRLVEYVLDHSLRK